MSFLDILKDSKIVLPYEWLATVPPVQGGRFTGTNDTGNNTFVLCWNEVSAELAASYEKLLADQGFQLTGESAMGGNRYAAFCGAEAELYLTYLPKKQELRIFAEMAGASIAPKSEPADYVTVEGYEPAVWQLSVDCKTSKQNGGMSYVIPVADGSFVVLDGGYPTEPEADHLFEFLKEHNPVEGKPRISAWLFTHLHGDHFGCFLRFAEKYADQVILDALYYNFPNKGHGIWPGYGKDITSRVHRLCDAMGDVTFYETVHAGSTFYVANARFDVMLTHEDLFPVTGTGQNDSSTVYRLTMGGQRVMFLGDIEYLASNVLVENMPADELKSDIVQLAHHGYEGATVELYDLINAPTVFWPMNIYGWQRPDPSNVFERWSQFTKTRRQPLANKYIFDEAEYVKKIIVAGAGTTAVKLPYIPEGDRLPDYKEIHDRIAAVEEKDAEGK